MATMHASVRVVDVRSDTLTQPSLSMREVMARSEVGDDVHGEDPTVNELQRQSALLLGKEAALFVPSGTMGNLISVLAHCDQRGMEVLLGDESHIFIHEQGGVSQIGGVHTRTVSTKADGTFNLDEVRQKIRSPSLHSPVTGCICIENTHNKCGGQVLPLHFIEKLGSLASENGLPLHMDGARMMNAAVFHKVTPATIARHCDSVSFCLSKGLGAPVGSVIVGTKSFIKKAIRLRKVLGGGMRQAGVLAAAGIYSLTNMIDRLEEDHRHAKEIALAIANLQPKSVSVDLDGLQTNILMIKVNTQFWTCQEFLQRLLQTPEDEQKIIGGSIIIKMFQFDDDVVRLVTHCDITDQHVKDAILKFQFVIKEMDQRNK